jgi:hypothetical protein
MIERCERSYHNRFHRYGGRGIRICERWRHDFEAFLADMGPLPGPRYSIERIDNDADYEPGNCRWATPKEQARNTRRNRLVTYAGRTLCVNAWAEELGMNRRTISARLKKGWSPEQALTLPLGSKP